MLQKLLSELMELPYPFEEALKKLGGTWILINDEMYRIEHINCDEIIAIDRVGDVHCFGNTNIKTIQVFLPKSGTYLVGDCFVTIERNPKRKWWKSFHWDFFKVLSKYKISGHAYEILEGNLVDFYKHGNSLFYMGYKVGDFKENKLLCVDMLFYQELLDWKEKTNATFEIVGKV